MLCFFNLPVSGSSKYVGKSTNSKINDEQLEKQRGGGNVKLLLIPFPFDAKHSAKVNGEAKAGDMGRYARRNGNSAKIMFPGDGGIRYAMAANKDIYKILLSLASAGNVHASDNKGFVHNAADNVKNGFTGFLILGDEVFGKENAVTSDYSENSEAYKAGSRGNSHNIGSRWFQIGNGKEVGVGIDYAGNFAGFENKANGNGFGGNSYGGFFQHGSQQKGNFDNFEVFGNGKSFGESFHSDGIGKFSVEDGKEGWLNLGFGGFGQGNAKENKINNYNGGFSGLRSQENGNGGFGGGSYQHVLRYHANENGGFGDSHHGRFRNQEMVHCERAVKEGTYEVEKANLADGYSGINAGSSNGKGDFEGKFEYFLKIIKGFEHIKAKFTRNLHEKKYSQKYTQ